MIGGSVCVMTMPSGLTRRETFRLGLGTMFASFLPLSASSLLGQSTTPAPAPAAGPTGPYTLKPLPYDYSALEPNIDTWTMQIHHDKHQKAYVDNANKLLNGQPELAAMPKIELLRNLDKVPEPLRTGLRNNVGGDFNHTLFWQMMSPKGGGKPTGAVAKLIDDKFSSFEEFQKLFNEAATKRFGSGWAWLVLKDGKAEIMSTANQDSPVSEGAYPLLGLDVWEHAYYLKYQNRRPDYITSWWNVVNWDFVNEQLKAAQAT